jgi:hypothetical protein
MACHPHTVPGLETASSCHLHQRGFGLGQPEGHIHGAVQVDGGRLGGVGRFTTAGLAVQSAQPVVAVGLKRAHAQLLGQGKSLPVVGFGLRAAPREQHLRERRYPRSDPPHPPSHVLTKPGGDTLPRLVRLKLAHTCHASTWLFLATGLAGLLAYGWWRRPRAA